MDSRMTIADRKQREKEMRRNEIIDTAEKLFYKKGFDAVTMDEIADIVEISKGSIYVYFKNKDSLFMHIVFRKWEEFGQYLLGQMGKGKTGEQKIRIMIQCFVDFAKENREYNDLATTHGPLIMRRMDKEDQQKMQEIGGRYYPYLFQAIGEGQQDGSIRRDLNPITLGFLIQLITMTVVSPDPSWKQGYAKMVGNYDDLVELYPEFIRPAIAGCPDR
ncbi:MAG: TetR/AcrR family transcriptional regulator [Methanoregula sp.]|nr:TetR/AcrR family transcriptional regulator [Methanoregula sp.]